MNNLFEEVEAKLAKDLDEKIYLPVKEEIAKHPSHHTLGFRKEQFKAEIHEELEKLYSLVDSKKELMTPGNAGDNSSTREFTISIGFQEKPNIFTLTTNKGRTLQSGPITDKKTEMLIRFLQAEVMLQ